MRVSTSSPSRQQGFSLLELILTATIGMLVLVGLFRIGVSMQARQRLTDNDLQMETVRSALRVYYRSHQQLPANALGPEVPVDELGIEASYRLDPWGQFYLYNPGVPTAIQDIPCPANPLGCAASLTSSGPDQRAATADDIVVYLNLDNEARTIAMAKLEMLMDKVGYYNALFPGVDNDGLSQDGQFMQRTFGPLIDEDPGAVAELIAGMGSTCPPTTNFANDPSEGLSTLDAIEQGVLPGCPAPLLSQVINLYGLPSGLPGGSDLDPWGNPFLWGHDQRFSQWGYSDARSARADRRFHQFFSTGPDGDEHDVTAPDSPNDDIISAKQ